jgi:GR25 family glycosyltransferase involved in LPS biosynthesis
MEKNRLIYSMNAYIISLNNPIQLINQVSEFGFNPILIKGVNGKDLTNQEIKENTTLLCSLICPKSTIGIAMSHILIWERFLKTKQKTAIVLEDDVVFTKNFKNQFDIDMKNVPTNFDLLYLGCFGCINNINFYTIVGSMSNLISLNAKNINKYINKPAFVAATHAYVISRKGAKRLLSYLKNKIEFHIDYSIQKLIRDDLITVYGLNKRIVYQTSTDETMSTNVSSTHPIILNNILSNYYIDTKVKASYATTFVIARVGDINLSLTSILFILFGIVLAAANVDIYKISIGYIILSIPDIYIKYDNIMILIHYLLLIIPFIIFKELDIWPKVDNTVMRTS